MDHFILEFITGTLDIELLAVGKCPPQKYRFFYSWGNFKCDDFNRSNSQAIRRLNIRNQRRPAIPVCKTRKERWIIHENSNTTSGARTDCSDIPAVGNQIVKNTPIRRQFSSPFYVHHPGQRQLTVFCKQMIVVVVGLEHRVPTEGLVIS